MVDLLVIKHMDREMHFLSLRSNEKQVDKVRRFKTWLISALKGRAEEQGIRKSGTPISPP